MSRSEGLGLASEAKAGTEPKGIDNEGESINGRKEIMTTQQVFEKYKHLDANLSDRDLLPETFWGSIILDLWSAIKESLKTK